VPNPLKGIDLSEYQDPLQVPYASFAFAIIRVSHGPTQDLRWRQHVWDIGVVHRPFGFYYVLENIGVSIEAQAVFFKDLVRPFAHTMGEWLDIARGDGVDNLISTSTVDRCRGVVDTGIYVNGSTLDAMPEYKRFERIWYAGTAPPARWLLWQTGQEAGTDVDVAADLGSGVRPGWEGFTWPNL
jgi:hypothetical protein